MIPPKTRLDKVSRQHKKTPSYTTGDIIVIPRGESVPEGYTPHSASDKGGESYIYTGASESHELAQENLAIQGALAEAQIAVSKEQIKIAREQLEMSKERYAYWKNLYQPVEKGIVRAAGVGIDPTYAAARAGADVTSSFDKSQQIQARNLQRAGIDPSSPRFVALANELSIARAAAEAGARNQARNVTTDTNFQRRYQAAQLGRDIPAQAASQAANAAGIYGSAAGTQRGAASTYQQGFQGVLAANQQGIDASQFQQQLAVQRSQLKAQEDAAMWGAVGQGIGTLGTIGIAAMCWVAREVYGADSQKWPQFRRWLLTKAPAWFRALYIAHGERFALWLRGRERLKSLIRWWMDGRIDGMEACHG